MLSSNEMMISMLSQIDEKINSIIWLDDRIDPRHLELQYLPGWYIAENILFHLMAGDNITLKT